MEQEQLLGELERRECKHPRLLARSWKALGGRVFEEKSRDLCVAYIDSAERTTNKKASRQFSETIRELGRSLKSKQRRKAWAESMLEPFAGHELLAIRRKTSVDPAFAQLCKFAERPVPSVAELEAAGARQEESAAP